VPATQPAVATPSFTGSAGDGRLSTDSLANRAARQAGGAQTAVPKSATKVSPEPPKPDEKKEPEKKKGILQRIFGVFK
jgi:hypothetical protein